MKKEIYLLFSVFTLLSVFTACQTAANLIYGTNKSITYPSKNNYLYNNFKNKNIDTTKVIFLQEKEYIQLAHETVSKNLSVYYGVAGKYFISGDQMNMNSCSGQFETLYAKAETNDADLQKSEITNKDILKKLNLNPNKKTALFIYSYKFGRLNNSKLYDVIEHLKKNDNFDYRLISLDNYSIKP